MNDELIIPIVIGCTLLFVVLSFSLFLLVTLYIKREEKHRTDNQRMLFEIEQRELNMSFKDREIALNEVSKEVHDNIGQLVNLIRMNLYPIEEYCTNSVQLELIKYVSELTDRVVAETKDISRSLNSDFIKKKGLYTVLEHDLDRINMSKNLRCSMQVEGQNNDSLLTAETQLTIYRIAQEAINNVLQHAHAQTLHVTLRYEKDNFKMVIGDDGVGFNMEEVNDKGTIGLNNMRQRAKLLNGYLDINTKPLYGSFITLSIQSSRV